AEDGIRDLTVTGVQTCALPISSGGVSAVIAWRWMQRIFERRSRGRLHDEPALRQAQGKPVAASDWSGANPTICRAWWSINLTIRDRKSTRLNSSHSQISYAVFC